MKAQRDQATELGQMHRITFPSGTKTLSGTLFTPDRPPRAAVVIHGATGVPQTFYHAFAAWLAEERGLVCLTYDYRDFGASASRPMARSRATMADWGIEDQAAAMAALAARAPNLPIWVIGHSLGGFMLPFHKDADRVERAIMVASGPVHWRDHHLGRLPIVLLFWFLLGPLATWAAGYLPGKRLGLGADLPSGVFWQWRRWCTTRGFFKRDLGDRLPMPDWYRVRARMKFVAIADDPDIPPATVWRLMQYYPAAAKRQLVLRPEAFGLKAVGHIGAFARKNAALWPAIVEEAEVGSRSYATATVPLRS